MEKVYKYFLNGSRKIYPGITKFRDQYLKDEKGELTPLFTTNKFLAKEVSKEEYDKTEEYQLDEDATNTFPLYPYIVKKGKGYRKSKNKEEEELAKKEMNKVIALANLVVKGDQEAANNHEIIKQQEEDLELEMEENVKEKALKAIEIANRRKERNKNREKLPKLKEKLKELTRK